MIAHILMAMAPSIVACAVALLVLPRLSPQRGLTRVAATMASCLLLFHYLVWRIGSSLPPAGLTIDYIFAVGFLLLETGALLAALLLLVLLSRTRDRSQEVERNRAWFAAQPAPLVDVFICTYNEERAILERTMIGAKAMGYANFRVWVLDDGRRPWLRDLAEQLECRYLTREENEGAKAGNINAALAHVAALPDPPQFIAILDADFVPRAPFLSRALCLFRDDRVAVVQTPQHFINPDPIQANLSAAHVWPDGQRFFFDVVMPSRDAWGVAFCCGSSSVIRFAHLQAIGGVPTEAVTEDYLLTLRLREHGYDTVYLNEPLTIGLAPEGVKEYVTQRSRWCLGLMQIVRGRSGPFSLRSNLSLLQRLSTVESFLGWSAVYYARAFALILPPLYLLFGVKCVSASLTDFLSCFLPYYVWQAMTMHWISRGRSMTVMTDVTQLLAVPAILRSVATGLFGARAQTFEVTAKGGDRGHRFVEWSLFRAYAAVLAFNFAGLAVTAITLSMRPPAPEETLALAWSWFNTIILTIVCFVCVEKPRRRKAERFAAHGWLPLEFGGVADVFRLADISITGARLMGISPAGVASMGYCNLRGERIPCTIERDLGDSFAIKFDESLPARIQAIRHFYEHDYVKPFGEAGMVGVGRAVMRRLFEEPA